MANFKPVVRTNNEFNAVHIRITTKDKAAYIKTSMIVHKSGIEKGEITDYSILGNCYIQIKEYSEKLNKINIENWTAPEIKNYLLRDKESISFSDFADSFIKQMINDNRDKQANSYRGSVNSLKKHLNKDDVQFSDITSKEINKWIQSLGNTARAKQMYPTHINKIFKSGMQEYNDYERDIIRIKYNPFELVKIPNADVPKKRFADLDIVRKILNTKAIYEREELAQDVVKLILCLAGINTVDLYNTGTNCEKYL